MDKTDLFCNKHQSYALNQIFISSNDEHLLKCPQCRKQAKHIQEQQILLIQELLHSNENTVFDNWPPVNNPNLLEELDQTLKNDMNDNLEIKISKFFSDFRNQIKERLDVAEKNMLQECFNLQKEKKNLLDTYNKMAEKEKIKQVFLNGNNDQEFINNGIKQIVRRKYNEEIQNTSILEKMLNQLKRQLPQILLSVPIIIQDNILNLIDRIDFFEGVNENFLYYLQNIEKKQPKQPKNMQIFFKTLTGKILTQTINVSDTISNIKQNIQEQEGFSFDLQRIMFAGKELENGKTLADYKILNESTLNLVLKVKNGVQVFIKTLTGKTITLEVEAEELIETIKFRILEKEGISVDQQKLWFVGKYLEDNKFITDYNIKHCSTLHLQIK